MNPFSALARRLLDRLPPQTRSDARDVRPFFVFLTVTLAAIYLWAVYTSPALQRPIALIPFTLLLALHAVLYWCSPYVVGKLRWSLGYLAVQTALAFVLTTIAGDAQFFIWGVYAPLIGVSIGVLWNTRLPPVAIGIFICLATINYILLSGMGSLIPWLIATVPVVLFTAFYVTLYTRQAEARARAQTLLAELETAHRQLADYAGRVEDLTLAAERQRVARELHDTLAQGLAGLILQLEAADSRLTGDQPGRAREIVQQAMARARAVLADSRRVITDLRTQTPPPDLAEAARAAAGRFTAETGLPCALEIRLSSALSEELRQHAYRAIAEGLSNIARHSKAQHARVKLVEESGQLEVEVCDDGVGFDPAAVAPGHYGLLGIREHARLAGGTMTVQSTAGAGACLTVRLPLET